VDCLAGLVALFGLAGWLAGWMDWMEGLDARLISSDLQARGVRGHVGSHVGEGDG
jgi:hypothetical protein